MELEHYARITKQAVSAIAEKAARRWPLAGSACDPPSEHVLYSDFTGAPRAGMNRRTVLSVQVDMEHELNMESRVQQIKQHNREALPA